MTNIKDQKKNRSIARRKAGTGARVDFFAIAVWNSYKEWVKKQPTKERQL